MKSIKIKLTKNEMPYVFHHFHIAEQMLDEDTTIVALLHDVIEDSEYTQDDLKNMGFSSKVCEALAYLTHVDTVPYMEYIKNCYNC